MLVRYDARETFTVHRETTALKPEPHPSAARADRWRLITIDLDETVWPCLSVIRAAESALYAWLSQTTPRLTAAHDPTSLREHRRALMQERPEIAHDLSAVRRLSLRRLMAELGYPARHADEAVALFQVHRNRVEPYPDVLPVLRALRQRYRLVSVTNGNAQVSRTPLRDVFHRSINAVDAGSAKPDPAMFRLAMDWAGVSTAETLHVGDDPLRDVEAARQIGLATVWVNRTAQSWPETLPPPLLEVADLHALSAWLGGPDAIRRYDAL